MCLVLYAKTSLDLKPKTAENDIECYKILHRVKGYIFTVYLNSYINDSCIKEGGAVDTAIWKKHPVTEENFENDIVKPDQYKQRFYVAEGAIHSFVSIEDAKEDVRAWLKVSPNLKYVIAKCIIPKGTLYFEGKGEGCLMNIDTYASMHIVYKEIINCNQKFLRSFQSGKRNLPLRCNQKQ